MCPQLHPLQELLAEKLVINPMADGRCFWSCIYLALAGKDTKEEWQRVSRNEQGFPSTADRIKKEQSAVFDFVCALVHSQVHHEDPETHVSYSNILCAYICACNHAVFNL